MIKAPTHIGGLSFSMASGDDLDAVRALLSANGLADEDIGGHIEHFLLARNGDRLIATVGVELLGSCGLLRSLCVNLDYRKRGLATGMCERIEAYSRNAGVDRLYLLTTTADAFFEGRGFLRCPRESVPSGVQDTSEFRSLCPFDTHAHEGEQITTVVDGELFFALGEEVIRVGPGEVIAIPPEVPHAVFTADVGAKAFDAWSPPPQKYQHDPARLAD